MRRWNALGQFAIAGANPRGMHPDSLAAEHIVARSVADEENVRGLEAHHLEDLLEDEWVRFSVTGVGGDYHRLEQIADPGVFHNQMPRLVIVQARHQPTTQIFA